MSKDKDEIKQEIQRIALGSLIEGIRDNIVGGRRKKVGVEDIIGNKNIKNSKVHLRGSLNNFINITKQQIINQYGRQQGNKIIEEYQSYIKASVVNGLLDIEEMAKLKADIVDVNQKALFFAGKLPSKEMAENIPAINQVMVNNINIAPTLVKWKNLGFSNNDNVVVDDFIETATEITNYYQKEIKNIILEEINKGAKGKKKYTPNCDDIIGNLKFNKYLKDQEQYKKSRKGIYGEIASFPRRINNELGIPPSLQNTNFDVKKIINNITYVSYKTRNIDIKNAEKILQKFKNASENIEKDGKVAAKNKITLKEYAILTDLKKAANSLDKLEKSGFIADKSRLQQLQKLSHECSSAIDNYSKNIFAPKLSEQKQGVVFFDNPHKRATLSRKSLDRTDKFRTLFSKYDHTSMLNVAGKIPHRAELIIGGQNRSKIDLDGYLRADSYKINISKLVPKKHHQEMEKIYGDEWKEILAEKYKAAEDKILSEDAFEKFNDLKASSGEVQHEAGKANLKWGGHKDAKKKDKELKTDKFQTIHENFAGDSYKYSKSTNNAPKQDMMCSEFNARIVIASMMEVNKQVLSDATWKSISKTQQEEIKEIMGYNIDETQKMALERFANYGNNISGEDQNIINDMVYNLEDYAVNKIKSIVEQSKPKIKAEEKTINLIKQGIVDIPIDKDEDLHKLHPGRLHKLLNKKGCIQKVELGEADFIQSGNIVSRVIKKLIKQIEDYRTKKSIPVEDISFDEIDRHQKNEHQQTEYNRRKSTSFSNKGGHLDL
ncbi:MAG: hypothetical protein HRU35_00855 [Rickettsiaceae bacterium]|nr:hypothetical protein [Rickettsiaceae bacterium]